MTSRKKPSVAFWATVVVVVVLVYPLSFGPAVWLVEAGKLPRGSVYCVYGPLVDLAIYEKHPIAQGLVWWAAPGRKDGWFTLWMMQPYVEDEKSQ
jgi:hypothetical protein